MRQNGLLHGLIGSLVLLSIVGVLIAPVLAPLPVIGALAAPAPTVELDEA